LSATGRLVPLGDEAPVGVGEIELTEPLPDLTQARHGGPAWTQVLVLVRLHTVPIGLVVADVREAGLPAAELARLVTAELSADIEAHQRADGLPATPLDAGGLPAAAQPACQHDRTRVLADAPPLSVLIPTRDRAGTLGRCLDSILACHYAVDRREIVVIDNVPRDDSTRALVDDYARRGLPVRYAREDSPGSASARNRGLEVVDNELLVFTDDDAYPDAWWLAELATRFVAEPDAGAVTGMLLPRELDTQPQLWFEQYGGFSRGFEPRRFTTARASDPGNRLYPYSAGVFGTGNNMAFRRSALVAVGGFDPALGNGTPALGGVDSEVLLRTVLSGQALAYEPRALVWHSHRADYDGLRRQIYSYGTGLTAYLAKTLWQNPHLLGDFLRRVPEGARFALSSSSEKNSRKTSTYPRDLTWAERRGMVHGLLAYPRSRRKYGPHRTPRAVRPR